MYSAVQFFLQEKLNIEIQLYMRLYKSIDQIYKSTLASDVLLIINTLSLVKETFYLIIVIVIFISVYQANIVNANGTNGILFRKFQSKNAINITDFYTNIVIHIASVSFKAH